jgi:low affinity Fe/Cu permease
MKGRKRFSYFSKWIANKAGQPLTFMLAMATIAIWLVTGPIFGFSDTWQLLINTGTTIVTFLMVFLIQNTQNRDTEAIQLKLDELIRNSQGAHNALLEIEELDQSELDTIKRHFQKLAQQARTDLKKGKKDTGTSDGK